MITARIAVATALSSAISSSEGARFEWLFDHTILFPPLGGAEIDRELTLFASGRFRRRMSRDFIDCRHLRRPSPSDAPYGRRVGRDGKYSGQTSS